MRVSIRFRFFIAALVPTLVALLALAAASRWIQRTERERLAGLALVGPTAVIRSLVGMPPELRPMVQNRMTRFVILTPEGRVLHINPPGKLQVETVDPRTLLPAGLPKRTVLGGREVLAMVTPCRWDGNPCLVIWYALMSDVLSVNPVAERLLWTAVLGALVVAAGLSLAFGLTTVAPLLRLRREVAGAVDGATLRQVTATDPGEVGELARAFNAVLSQLGAYHRRQQVFVANTSHQLRTPLTVVKARLAQLGDPALPAVEREELVARLQGEVDVLANTVHDLLLLEQLEDPPERRRFDLSAVVRRVVDEMELPVFEKGIELVTDVTPGVTLNGSEARFAHLVRNLLDNAIKYTPAEGTVQVTLRPGALVVEDSGIGVPPAERDRVFERLYRAESAREVAGGSGLGLAIVGQVAADHGARVRVEDSLPGGARLVVELPADVEVTHGGSHSGGG